MTLDAIIEMAYGAMMCESWIGHLRHGVIHAGDLQQGAHKNTVRSPSFLPLFLDQQAKNAHALKLLGMNLQRRLIVID